jgi:hypothetical protein
MKQILKSNIDPNWPLIEIDYHKPVELFIDSFQGLDVNKDSYKILYVKEQDAISRFKQHAIANHNRFDLILTYDDEIIEKCPNATMMLFGTAWVHNYEFPEEKKFQISNLTGHKTITKGHLLRQETHYKQSRINNPIDFYISKFGGVRNINNNKILGEGKEPLFDSQFHICIENTRQDNYFTEKLIDCFVTKTIPIYYGAPNISEFFDTRGMYVVENFKDILEVCNSIDENTYKEKLEYVEKNFIEGTKYAILTDCLKDKLDKVLK